MVFCDYEGKCACKKEKTGDAQSLVAMLVGNYNIYTVSFLYKPLGLFIHKCLHKCLAVKYKSLVVSKA